MARPVAPLSPMMTVVLQALRDTDNPITVTDLILALRERHGRRFCRGTIYTALADLRIEGLATYVDKPAWPRHWTAVDERTTP